MSAPPNSDSRPAESGPEGLSEDVLRLLDEANAGYRTGLEEARAWHALRERRQRSKARRVQVVLAALTLGGVTWLVKSAHEEQALSIVEVRQEPLRAKPAPAISPAPAAPTNSESSHGSARPAGEQSSTEASSKPVAAVSKHRSQSSTESECRALASRQRHSEAAACFAELADAGGLEADVALVEQARLIIHHLHEPTRGLDLLDRHRTRLGQGPLRGEVAQLRVVALFALGHDQQALAESEAVIAAPWGQEAAPRMRWLRGRIYEERLGDCASAAAEYVALLGVPGAQGDAAEYRRARCLEQIGQPEAALRAYELYLRREAPARANEARQRSDQLRASVETE